MVIFNNLLLIHLQSCVLKLVSELHNFITLVLFIIIDWHFIIYILAFYYIKYNHSGKINANKIYRERERDRQTDRQTDRDRDRETHRERQRQRERHRHTEKQRQRETDWRRQRDRQRQRSRQREEGGKGNERWEGEREGVWRGVESKNCQDRLSWLFTKINTQYTDFHTHTMSKTRVAYGNHNFTTVPPGWTARWNRTEEASQTPSIRNVELNSLSLKDTAINY